MNEKYRIVVDAGHGGVDSGAVSGNLQEKDFTLEAANYMYNRFKELGVPVVITRDTDESLTRTDRVNKMKSLGTDPNVIVLSNHINAGGGEGAEVVYPLRSTSTLANNILNEIGARGQIKRKTYQRSLPENPNRDYYYIMRDTPNATTLLIEYGFIDNPKDAIKLQNNLLDYAEGVVKAVSEYIGVPYTKSNSNIIGDSYIVKRGDTLYSIARKFNTSVNEIKRVNNLQNDNLSIGQEIKIPSKEFEEEYELYTILPNDTIYSISKKNNISINDLLEYNALTSNDLIIGTTIKIPKKSSETKENIYIVKPGDTLYRVAKMYNISINDLMLANNLSSNILTIGEELVIPIKPVVENDFVVYEVQSGDTLYSIAKRYNTKVDTIKAYNNLINNILPVGLVLQIPLNPQEYIYQEYQIKPGDTLYSIANRFNTTVANIMAINDNLTNILKIGEIIRIPQ